MRAPRGEADRFELNAPFRAARERLSVLGLVQSAAVSPVLGSRYRVSLLWVYGKTSQVGADGRE